MNFVFHRKVHFQGVLEFTNHCPRNCLFCRRRRKTMICPGSGSTGSRSGGACELGYRMGIRSFLLQGGEDHYYTDMIMCNLLRNLQQQFPDCALGLSIGERSRQSYHRLHQAGAQRYFLSFQTADPLHFSRLHPPTHALSTKIACFNDLKDLGYETDTGFLVGAPYEQVEYLVRDLTLLQELAPHSITLIPFLPEEGTPFYQQDRMALEEYLRLTAVLRILFPRANIVAPWSIRRIHAHGQILSVQSGPMCCGCPWRLRPGLKTEPGRPEKNAPYGGSHVPVPEELRLCLDPGPGGFPAVSPPGGGSPAGSPGRAQTGRGGNSRN